MEEAKIAAELSRDDFCEQVGVETRQGEANHSTKKKPGRKRRGLWEQPPKVIVIDGEPLTPAQLETLKELIKGVALRKLAQLREEKTPETHQQTSTAKEVNTPRQHIIHKAIKWGKLLKEGKFKSQSEIAEKEGLTRARVTQIMNLVKLPPEWKEFLTQLNNPKEISKYSERKLRKYYLHQNHCKLCPINRNPYQEPIESIPNKPCELPLSA